MKRCWMILMMVAGATLAVAAGGEPDPLEETCRNRMRWIGQALAIYAYDHGGDYPVRLGDLVGEYLAEAFVLSCPAAEQRGEAGLGRKGVIDPSDVDGRTRGYTWELTPEKTIFVSGGSDPMTYRELKRHQMETAVGDRVPIVRCGHHQEKWLNLVQSGAIYESALYWECLYVDVVPWPYLTPELVKASRTPMKERLPQRPNKATAELLDLRPWYNARWKDPWIYGEWGQELDSFAAALQDGLFRHHDVVFDAAGLIQLNGALVPQQTGNVYANGYNHPHYPSVIRGIPVDRTFRRLHLLAGVLFQSPPGSEVARLELTRVDGSSPGTIRWVYGRDVASLFYPLKEGPEHGLDGAQIAWISNKPGAAKMLSGFGARFFYLTWDNPLPDVAIQQIDFYAGDQPASPFILGLTLED